ncbi:hypothetical protein M378DRAFT_19232 [Amanita muscaria Koide BX008]|uniref:Uncharacterized protein n=1 Tax=Amanita muscaria (strain Koide BX008) TaxID=946122 RepID=A0A0C2VZ18_AMAMK|nr:hypothetical protein M378DRAFT_19232 [Amanita muscaria Koide BX008]
MATASRVSVREKNPSARLTADNVEPPALSSHRASIAAATARAKAKNPEQDNTIPIDHDDTSQGQSAAAAKVASITIRIPPLTQTPGSVTPESINNVEEIDKPAPKRLKNCNHDTSETDANGMYTDTHVMDITDDENNKKRSKNKKAEVLQLTTLQCLKCMYANNLIFRNVTTLEVEEDELDADDGLLPLPKSDGGALGGGEIGFSWDQLLDDNNDKSNDEL